MRKKTIIIAEAGVNHNGDINLAKKLIDAAATAGADLVKFQTFVADRQVTRQAIKADYQMQTAGANDRQYDMLRKLELTEAMHHELIAHCKRRNIEFLSTGFDTESIDFLVTLRLGYLKIPSGEITNLPYLRHIGRLNKTIILSTGMSTLGDVEEALLVLERSGTPRTNIIVLQCTSEYPASMEVVNLRAMLAMQAAFGVSVGYSDHTQGIEVAIAAVAMGASVIEKHFTLDRSLSGPDHQASIEPEELQHLVTSIRNVERALGDGIKRPSLGELRNKSVVRKSLVASKFIKAGDLFSAENVTIKRPGTGITPMHWDHVLGQCARRDFLVDELIEL